MAAPMELSVESVRLFLIERGGRITNHEITSHYKKILSDPQNKDAKSMFKDIVNTLATVKKVNNEKYLVLKKKYREGLPNRQIVDTPPATPTLATSPRAVHASYDALDFLPSQKLPQSPPTSPKESSGLPHSISSPDLKSIASSSATNEAGDIWEPVPGTPVSVPKSIDMVPDKTNVPVPVAPLRKKKSMKENRKPRAPVPPKQGDESSPGSQPEASDEADDGQRISVKEQAKKLNKMASESQLNKPLTPNSITPNRRRDTKLLDDDDASSQTADPNTRREWELKSARADYHALLRILKDHPGLAKHKDVIYTALHWAAKHGNQNIVKLIAGTHVVDVNIRSGYTALHVAALHNYKDVYDLLVQTYGADENLRDYSGKKAQQLFKDYKAKKAKTGSHRSSGHRRGSDRELGFLRIGSLNVKVRRTAEAFTSRSEIYLRKGWGSADSIPEANDEQLMPPPKQAPPGRRHKPKQRPVTVCTGSMDSLQTDSESDSAAGFKP